MKRKNWLYLCAMLVLLAVALLVTPFERLLPTLDPPDVTTTTTAATAATIKDEPMATETGAVPAVSTTTSKTEKMTTTTQGTSASSTTKKQTTVKKETTSTTAKATSTTKKVTTTTKKATKTTKKATKTTAKKQEMVQAANPETGISWDGKSPIIYTYKDGSTGTKPEDGATYEVVPGIKGVYFSSADEVYDGKCPKCGKTEGDGRNGTCLSYWTGGEHECPHCGKVIPEDTCHTCE